MNRRRSGTAVEPAWNVKVAVSDGEVLDMLGMAADDKVIVSVCTADEDEGIDDIVLDRRLELENSAVLDDSISVVGLADCSILDMLVGMVHEELEVRTSKLISPLSVSVEEAVAHVSEEMD